MKNYSKFLLIIHIIFFTVPLGYDFNHEHQAFSEEEVDYNLNYRNIYYEFY